MYKPTAEKDNLTELSRVDGVAEFDNVHGNTYEDGRQVLVLLCAKIVETLYSLCEGYDEADITKSKPTRPH